MLVTLKTWRLVAGALLIGLSTTACAQLPIPRIGANPDADLPALANDNSGSNVDLSGQSTANATPTPLPANEAYVKTGSIQDTYSALGRVAPSAEQDIMFPGTGKVDAVAVKAGDKVEAGQLLLQIDSTQIQRDLASARTRLENDSARVQQAIDQLNSQSRNTQRANAARAADDQQHRQQAIVDAQTAVRRAQDNLDKVQAGPSTTDVRTAQTALANAQNALTKAQSDRDTLQKGANPSDVRAAERVVTNAQTDLDKAQADVDRLTRGPDPTAVASAERDVQRAQTSLQVAQSQKVDGKEVTQTAHDALVANAKLGVQDAQDKLNNLKQPPAASDVSIAQRNLQTAKSNLDIAKQQLDTVKQGPDQATLDAADHAVDNAQAIVDNSQDRLDELNSHPTPQELRDATDRVTQAQRDLANAQKPVSAAAQPDDSADQFNIQLLQKAAATDQTDIDTLQAQLDATKLLSPDAGVISNVQARAGDAVDPSRPVMTLSAGGAPVVQIDLTEQDAARIKPGQTAKVTLDGSTTPIDAAVSSVVPNKNAGVGRTAILKVSWPDKTPSVGTNAQVGIVVQNKDNVLLVPKKAIRSAGTRKFVQYMSGSSRKVANVEVGIVTDDMAEIVSGLTEGQIVIVGA